MKQDGFTLIELLIAVFIVGIVMAYSGNTFIKALSGIKTESRAVTPHMDKLFGLELLRLDLEHLGYGIASDTTDLPVEWTEGILPGNRELIIRSTLNNSNQGTVGWYLLDCTSGSPISGSVLSSGGSGLDNALVLVSNSGTFGGNTTYSANCPATAVYTAFPYDNSVTDGCAASGQFCNQVTYKLSTSQDLSSCAAGSRNLLRAVGGGSGVPVLNCVADFFVRFDLDTNSDGTIDSAGSATPPGTTSAIMDQVKQVHAYVLQQVSTRDNDYTFSGDTTVGGEVTFNTAGVTNFTNYHWKVVKLSEIPMGFR